MTRVIEPAPRTGDTSTGVSAVGGAGADALAAERSTDTASALSALVVALDRACEELFAAVPFPGDQATGASVNAFVDDVVAALLGVRAEADDLRRVIAIAEQRSRGGA